MNARTQMRQRCTVERNAAVQKNSWGVVGDPKWEEHLVTQPCYCWFDSGTLVEDGSKTVTTQGRRIIFPSGTDVDVGDRIVNVTNRLGTEEYFEGPAKIVSVGRRSDHVVAVIEDVL